MECIFYVGMCVFFFFFFPSAISLLLSFILDILIFTCFSSENSSVSLVYLPKLVKH